MPRKKRSEMTPKEADRIRILDRDRQRRKRERDHLLLMEARGKTEDNDDDDNETIKLMKPLTKKKKVISEKKIVTKRRCDMTPEQLDRIRFKDNQRQRKKRSEMSPEQLRRTRMKDKMRQRRKRIRDRMELADREVNNINLNNVLTKDMIHFQNKVLAKVSKAYSMCKSQLRNKPEAGKMQSRVIENTIQCVNNEVVDSDNEFHINETKETIDQQDKMMPREFWNSSNVRIEAEPEIVTSNPKV